jgi:predicted site-specific integrase-resolvase
MSVIEDYINNLVKEEVKKALGEMKQSQTVVPDKTKPVYTEKDMIEMLQIDRKTLKKYRDEGLLGCAHPFDKRFYSPKDLEDFLMNKNIRYEAFNIK